LYFIPSTLDSSLLSNIQKLFYERIEVFGAVGFYKLSIVTGIIKIFLKVQYVEVLSWQQYMVALSWQCYVTIMWHNFVYHMCSSQALLECVRLRTFGKYGLQQMQVDAHYLQIYLWRFVSDEQW